MAATRLAGLYTMVTGICALARAVLLRIEKCSEVLSQRRSPGGSSQLASACRSISRARPPEPTRTTIAHANAGRFALSSKSHRSLTETPVDGHTVAFMKPDERPQLGSR